MKETSNGPRHHSRRLWRAAIPLLVAVSCGAPPTPGHTETNQAVSRKEIRVALFKSPAVDALVPLVSEFETLTDTKVQLDVLPYSELLDKVRTEFIARSSTYDIVMADCIWIPSFATAGYLQPIDAMLKDPSLTPSTFDLADIIPSVGDYLGKYPANGVTYGFPFMTNSHVLAYRSDLFEKYLKPKGFRRPGKTVADAWTWDEYLRAAKVLTGPDKDVAGGKRWGSSMQARAGAWIVYEWYSWLYGTGGRDIDYAAMQPAFTRPESIQAIERYAGMVGTVAPAAVTSWGHEEETQAMGSGLTALDATSNIELVGYLLDPTKSKFAKQIAFGLSPVGSNKKPTPDMGGYGILLSKFSRQQREAFKFMVWATSQSVHRRVVLAGGSPFRNSEMSDAQILAKFPVYEIYGTALANSVYRGRVPKWPEIEDVISKELTRALTKEASPAEAAAAMQNRVQALLSK